MPNAASGVATSERSDATITMAGRSGQVARSSCMPSTSTIIGSAASLRSAIGPRDGVGHGEPQGQGDAGRERAVDRGHARDAGERLADRAAAARGKQDAAGVAEDGARDEVDAGKRQRLAAEREQGHRQPVVAAVGADDHEEKCAERSPVEAQRDGGEPGHHRGRGGDQHVERGHAAELEARQRGRGENVEHQGRRQSVKRDARQRLDLHRRRAGRAGSRRRR